MIPRRQWTSLMSAMVLAGSLALTITPTTTAAGGTTRWVDDGDPAGCTPGSAPYGGIQAAVTASGPGDTVLVCPGKYTEQVRVKGHRGGLTLRSVKPWAATIVAPSDVASYNLATLVLVQHVNGVTVRGFRLVAPTAAPCSRAGAMLGALASLRVSLRGNRISAKGSDTLGACGFDWGVVIVDSSGPAGATAISASGVIADNLVTDFQMVGVGSIGSADGTNVSIIHNSVRYYHTSTAVAGLRVPAGARLSGRSAFLARTSTRAAGRLVASLRSGAAPSGAPAYAIGIGVLGSVRAVVSGNVVQSAPGAGGPGGSRVLDEGVYVDHDSFTLTPRSVTVRGNLVRRTILGIHSLTAHGVRFGHNTVRNSAVGLALESTDGSVASANDVTGYGVGLLVTSTSSGNQLLDNVTDSCEDDSVGPDPDPPAYGTADTWIGNVAPFSYPAGICAAP